MVYDVNGNELEATTKPRKLISLTNGLKEKNLKISAKKANDIFLMNGIICLNERLSEKTGDIKIFKTLTEHGLKYGKNLRGMKGKGASIKFYEDMFMDLLIECKMVG